MSEPMECDPRYCTFGNGDGERLRAEIERLREQLSHAVPAIEQLTKEREEYRTRWLASEVELRLALEALAHEQKLDGQK